jgi:hypothetical protein
VSAIIYGNVIGDTCPECKESLDIYDEFREGEEFKCDCGATCVIDTIEATYTLSLSSYRPEDDEEDEDPTPAPSEKEGGG